MVATDCIADYYEESPELSAPFAMAFGPEIVDNRISPQARLLRIWLRFRCAGQYDKNVVSFQTLAEDFGAGESTIRKWAEELRSIGAIAVEKRGFGRSSKKVLAAPSSVYDTATLVSFRRLLKHERTDEDLKRLRSELDNPSISSALENEPSTPLKNERTTALKNERSEVEEREVDQTSTLKSTSKLAASQRTTEEGEIKPSLYEEGNIHGFGIVKDKDIDNIVPVVQDQENRDFSTDKNILVGKERDTRLDECRSSLGDAEIRAKAKALIALERAEAKARAKQKSGLAEEEKKAKQERRKELRAQRGPTANDVEDWWNSRMRDLYPEIPNMGWTLKDKKWARELLDRMGPEKLEALFDLIFEKWESFQLRFPHDSLPQAPIFSWVYMKRERLAQEVVTIKPKSASVHAADSKKQKYGW